MKKWYKSKEVLFSILYLVIVVAECLGFSDFVPGQTVNELAMLIPIITTLILRLFFTESKLVL